MSDYSLNDYVADNDVLTNSTLTYSPDENGAMCKLGRPMYGFYDYNAGYGLTRIHLGDFDDELIVDKTPLKGNASEWSNVCPTTAELKMDS